MTIRQLLREGRQALAENGPPQVGMHVRINASQASAAALLDLVQSGVDLPKNASGEWEVYNVTGGMIHMGRVVGGKKAAPSKANLLNLSPAQFTALINGGVFQAL